LRAMGSMSTGTQRFLVSLRISKLVFVLIKLAGI
jgi:hypothetical protein